MSSDVLDRSLNNNKNKIATIYFHIVTLNIGYSLMTIQPAVLFIAIFFPHFIFSSMSLLQMQLYLDRGMGLYPKGKIHL